MIEFMLFRLEKKDTQQGYHHATRENKGGDMVEAINAATSFPWQIMDVFRLLSLNTSQVTILKTVRSFLQKENKIGASYTLFCSTTSSVHYF